MRVLNFRSYRMEPYKLTYNNITTGLAITIRFHGASLRQVCEVLRRVWRRSARTHCNTIYLLSEREPMEVIIQRRFLNFANSLQNNEMLITIANVGMNKPCSTFGCNYVIHE